MRRHGGALLVFLAVLACARGDHLLSSGLHIAF